ncbi:HET-domain-containing protein [Lentithecium fluviatile CBS 122367]|uniref:HET-domain-containing protein n=1 Tax=Lentithecium fluviatile CBS 122367 TaxID=1168545 RepID=A0A6G1IRX4_9PLEO|nr:HET-domain-containing protein [Lentithecium fluviatile CBS 122367]
MSTQSQALEIHRPTPCLIPYRTPYSPINSTAEETRLIKLLPGDYDDAIEVRLHTVCLSKRPTFDALSYAWGTELSPREVLLNGVLVPVTSNLDCALRHLRLESASRMLWVDALCINQDDVQERSLQVRLMDEIYSSAEQVVIWLGSATKSEDTSDHNYAAAMACIKLNVVPKSIYQEASLVKAFDHLISRPWFSRVWVVQELALAKRDPVVCIGRYSVPWSQLTDFILGPATWSYIHLLTCKPSELTQGKRLDYPATFLERKDQIEHLCLLRKRRLHRQYSSLAYLLRNTGKSFASDPRDKVYGILGLSTPNTVTMIADYSLSVQRVFSEAMALLIGHSLWQAFGMRPLHPPRKSGATRWDVIPELPSWVFNLTWYISGPTTAQWDSQLHNSTLFLIPQDEFLKDIVVKLLGVCPVARFLNNFSTLYTIGASIGTVAATSLDTLSELSSVPGMLKSAAFSKLYYRIAEPRDISIDSFLEALEGYSNNRNSVFNQDIPGKKSAFQEIIINPDSHDIISQADGLVSVYHRILFPLVNSAYARILFVTDKGHIGLSYHPDPFNGIRPGDLLVGLFGINFPFLLRPVAGGYQMINVAYVVDHKWGHDFVETAEPVTDWKELGNFGLKEYKII